MFSFLSFSYFMIMCSLMSKGDKKSSSQRDRRAWFDLQLALPGNLGIAFLLQYQFKSWR